MPDARAPITKLARRWSAGDRYAFAELIDGIYPELRALAQRQLSNGRRTRDLSTTVLVHEAYLKLAGGEGRDWEDRSHLFAYCATVMRHILVDIARRRAAVRRGGGRVRVTLTDGSAVVEAQTLDLLALDQALQRIASRNERMARIVECRFFAGMSVSETATALDVSTRTVEREWARARLYLRYALDESA